MKMYVYLDETTFGKGNEYSGYGCLITTSRIEKSVIDQAMKYLAIDPDINKEKFKKHDEATLKRNFFHASEDSQNGHSHLCNAINEHIKGKFHSQFFDTIKSGFANSEEVYHLASKLSMMSVLSESDEIVFIFEERNNLNQEYIEKWWQSLWVDLLKSQHKYPFMRTFYPSLEFEIKTKVEPGLQVVDFILWASTRNALKIKCPWLDRLKAWFKSETIPADGTWGGHSLTFGALNTENKAHYEIKDFKIDDEKLNSLDYLYKYLVNVQNVINLVVEQGRQKNVDHFWDELTYLKNTENIKLDAEHIEKMANCFLKLFDNFGVISANSTPQDKSFWITCRRCFAYVLHTHEVGGRFHGIRLSDMRNNLIDSKTMRSE